MAALVTLAIDPGIAADVGWQLSFAAVLGILLLAGPLRGRIVARLGDGSWRRALAEGLAVTVAATLATAPLIAYHFETLSTTTLAANVLALPAVAPAMWLGMCSAGLAQLPGVPLEPLNGLDALLLAYVAQVAERCAAPSWAELRVHLGGPGLALSYLGLGLGLLVCWRWPGRAFAVAGVAAACWLPLPSLGGVAAEPPAGCGWWSWMSGRATRSCSSPRMLPPFSSMAVLRATAWRASWIRPEWTGSAPWSSPTTSPTTWAASKSWSVSCRWDVYFSPA
jgi:Competence protein